MIASMVPAAVSVQAADGDSIRLVNGKIEVDAQLKKLAEMYEKETGTKVENRIHGTVESIFRVL